MAIVSSSIKARWGRWVSEEHVDQDGKSYTHQYFSDESADLNANLSAYATALSETLANEEINEVLG